MSLGNVLPITSNLAQLATSLIATWACVRRARRSERQAARAWWALGLSTGSWALGEMVWCAYEVVLQRPAPFPSIADIAFLTSIPLALIGLAWFVDTPAGALSRARAVVEGGVITCGLLLVSWLVLLGPVVRSSAETPFGRAVSLAYPIGDCLLLAVAVFAATRRSGRDLATVVTLATGFGALAVADSAFAVLQQTGTYSSGRLADIGWIVGFILIALGARREPTGRTRSDFGRVGRVISLLAPFVPPALGCATTAVVMLAGGRLDSAAVWIATLSVLLLVVLQLLVSSENDVLTADLEHRMARRTRQLALRERQFATLVEHSSDVTFVLDDSHAITYVSGSARSVMGLDPDLLVGVDFTDLVDPDDRPATLVALDARGTMKEPVRLDAMVAGGGLLHPLQLTITDLRDEPAVRAIVVNGRDIRDRRVLEDQLRHDALHDALTGMPNRRLLLEHIQLALDRQTSTPGAPEVALLMVDLDDFKAVNDGFGHQAGDEFLLAISSRLRRSLAPRDLAARLGGDEFAVLVSAPDTEAILAAADRVLDALRGSIRIGGLDVTSGASIGIRILAEGATPTLLLRDADIALYAAKSAGKNRFEVFDPELGEKAARRLTLKADLRDAWRRGEISVVFQPIVDMSSSGLRGAEALVRWTHPQFGSVSPVEFIPLAEETGAVIELGRAVLEEACRRAAQWCRTGSLSYISVNVSPVQLGCEGFPELVDEVLEAAGLEPSRLLLEVTEGVLLTDFEGVVSVLGALRSRGIRTALDDFGTGYSSLSYAQHLPFDVVKIDRAFTMEAASASSIVPAIMQIAALLGADVVAEGIETAEQAAILRAQGCRLGQGFLYSTPVPASTFELYLTSAEVRPLGLPRASSESVPVRVGGHP